MFWCVSQDVSAGPDIAICGEGTCFPVISQRHSAWYARHITSVTDILVAYLRGRNQRGLFFERVREREMCVERWGHGKESCAMGS